MKILQTLATDNLDNMHERELTRQLLFHFMSSTSIRQAYGNDQEFILISDSRGKALIESLNCFPYTSITTDLDNWPYTRPHKEVGYKLYGFQLYPDDDVIHFDNDIFLKNPVPTFTDVLVQGSEGNFVEEFSTNSDQQAYKERWVWPPSALSGSECKLKYNYNPGTLGLTASSSIREQYVSDYHTYLEINTNNINQLETDDPDFYATISQEERQWINTTLEESYLYHLCEDNNVNVVQVLDPNVVPPPLTWNSETNNRDEFFTRLYERHHNHWKELGYRHPFNIKNHNHSLMSEIIGGLDSTPAEDYWLPQMSGSINDFLRARTGLSPNPSIQETNITVKKILTEYDHR